MSLLRTMVILPLLLALAACDESRLVVDPLGEARVCETDFAGTWRIDDDGGGAPDFLLLDAQCNAQLLSGPRAGEGGSALDQSAAPTRIALAPSIGRIDGVLFVTLTDDDFHRAAGDDDDKPEHGGQRSGFHVYRVEATRQRVLLRAVDHAALAKAIIDNKVKGEVSKTEDGLKNLVQLDSAGVRKLIGERWLFRRKDPLSLERVAPSELPAALRAQTEAGP